jgi:ABC-2 type transport system ATP-binding protein
LIAVERIADLLGKTQRRVSVEFAAAVNPADLRALPGVTDLKSEDGRISFRVAGDLDPVVKAIALHTVADLELAHPTLEEVFLTYYEEGAS